MNRQSVTIKDVAKLAGVSVSTASRAITGVGGVSPQLEERILAAAKKLSYRPNAAARGLRKARTATLGIVFNNLRGPGQLDLLKGIGTICNTAGFGLLAADANGDHAVYLQLIRGFFEQRVEGLFLVSPIDLRDALADFVRHEVPVITLLRKDASAGTLPIVAASERRGIHDAMSALVEMGHREIAYLFRYWDERRVRDVIEGLAAAGHAPNSTSRVFEGDSSDQQVDEAIRSMLNAGTPPTALVVQSTLIGPSMAAFQGLGLQLGRDISLVCVGASSWHQLLQPGIAAVEADYQVLGQLACRTMLDWVAGTSPAPAYSELARWVPRASAGPPFRVEAG